MSQKDTRNETRSNVCVVAIFALPRQNPVLQLQGVYHDKATDDEKAKKKALCAEEQRILMTQHCHNLHKQLPTDKEAIYKLVTGCSDILNLINKGSNLFCNRR
jgi:hypothetical protein